MAASGVNIKMGVSGVNEVKRHMKDVQNSVKTLNTALALNEKEFKATGDAEAYMSKKSELLNVKIEQQKSIVHDAETALKQMTDNGVDKASKAFQDMQQQVNKAKGELIDAETALANISDSADTASVNVGFANQELQNIGNGISYQNITDGLEKITNGLGNVIKRAWNAGKALAQATLGAGSWADELQETAEKYSTSGWVISPEDLQRMQYAANFIDTDVESIVASRKKLMKALGGEDEDFWSFMHSNSINTRGVEVEDIFWNVGEAIMAMTDETKQEKAAQKAFGKSWADLKPLFNAGREEYKRTMDEASVLTNEQVDNLGKMDDAYQKMQSEWETFQRTVLEAFSGPMTQAMDAISGLLGELNEYLQTDQGKEMLQQMGDTISSLIEDLVNINPEDVVSGLKSVIDGITDALKWIKENSGLVKGGLIAIGGGFLALKIASAGTTIAKLVNALSGLGASEAATAGAEIGSSWASSFASAAIKAVPWLAGLATLLTPSAGSDAHGNNDNVDENGNLTEEGKLYGNELDENGLPYLTGAAPEKYREEGFDPQYYLHLQDRKPSEATGDAEGADARNRRWIGSIHQLDDLTGAVDKMEQAAETLTGQSGSGSGAKDENGNVLNGLPAVIANSMRGWKVTMDGEVVGMIVSKYVDERLGGDIVNTW